MQINYRNKSFRSIIIKILIILSGFKKNTISVKNTKKYIQKSSNKKLKKKIFKNMYKIDYDDYTIYSTNKSFDIDEDAFLLYAHGGSFIDKPFNIQVKFAKKLANKMNASLLIPMYDTLPDGNAEKFMDEFKKIYIFLLDKNKKIYLMGDSAGGGGVLALDMILCETKIKIPDATILLSPWLDLSLTNIPSDDSNDIVCSIPGHKYCGELWSGNYDVKDYKVSPFYGEINGLNKIFISCSGNEICKYDCINFVNKLKNDKIDYRFIQFDNLFHNFELYPIAESKTVIEEITRYIKGND